MMACCSTEQWFSRDRTRGYGDAWGDTRQSVFTRTRLVLVLVLVLRSSTHSESVLADRLDDLNERHLGGEGVSVVDDRFSVSVPAVQLHAAAAVVQGSKRNS